MCYSQYCYAINLMDENDKKKCQTIAGNRLQDYLKVGEHAKIFSIVADQRVNVSISLCLTILI